MGRGSSSRGVTGYGPHGPMGNGEHSAYQDAGAHGLQQGDGRFAALLGKGGAEQAARARAEGIPGPWEPVTGAREVRGLSFPPERAVGWHDEKSELAASRQHDQRDVFSCHD